MSTLATEHTVLGEACGVLRSGVRPSAPSRPERPVRRVVAPSRRSAADQAALERSIAAHPASGRPGAGLPAVPARSARVAAGVAPRHERPVAPGGELRLTRRGRFVLGVIAVALVVAGVMGGRAVANQPAQAVEVETYAVQSGDTLWGVAAEVVAPGQDVRDVVAQLQELNHLPGSGLVAGQTLAVPAGR